MEMLKDELKALYKAKPELIEEHKRLVDVLRTGSKKEQVAEAERQLKELKEMVGKADRCWEGYEPTPGKKPYEKGSCRPVEKQEIVTFDKQESGPGWHIKIKGEDGYHPVKDVVDMGPQKHNSYLLHDGRTIHHDQVEDLSFAPRRPGVNVRKTSFDDEVAAIKAKYSVPKEKSFKEKINEIKQKHADKPELTEDQRIGAIKMKYTSMFKSQDMQKLIQEVSTRQPTDVELEAILEYNSQVAQEIANTPPQINEEDFGY
jgi:phage host-nuclease inhibitor protein Gam